MQSLFWGPRLLLWVDWVILFEGGSVVLEPNGRYSRFGVTVKTEKAARLITPRKARILALQHVHWVWHTFPEVRRNPKAGVRLVDFTWHAGRAAARRVYGNGGTGMLTRIASFYKNLLRRPKYAKYRNGWIRRLVLVDSIARGAIP